MTLNHLPPISDELLARLDCPGPRYTSYPTVPEWGPSFGPAAHAAALDRAARDPAPLSLYVHIPFCREMCTYCGCNVVVTRDARKKDRFLDVLEREVALVAARLGAGRPVTRLHLGGGTPTSLDEAQLARLWGMLARAFAIAPGAELAVEIDPVVTSPAQLALLRGFGWNRISMGVQDFDPIVQEAVNRRQSVAETRAIVDEIRRQGWSSVNFDLIYGLPWQRPEGWRRMIEQVIELRPDRVALFSFAYVPAMKPHQRRLPVAGLPAGRAKLDLFLQARAQLAAAGWTPIGMDHFAVEGDELARAAGDGTLWRDFQGYTTQRAPDTIGLGPSSISFVGGAYVQSEKILSRWEAQVAAGRLPAERGLVLGADDLRRRDLITALMCNFAVDVGEGFAPELAALAPLEADGLVQVRGTRVEATPLGRLFVRNLAMVFDAYLAGRVAGARPVFSRTV